jgi:hypothetical protein
MSELDLNFVCLVDVYLVRNSAGRVGGELGSPYALEFLIDALSFHATSSFVVSTIVTMCTSIEIDSIPPGRISLWSDSQF